MLPRSQKRYRHDHAPVERPATEHLIEADELADRRHRVPQRLADEIEGHGQLLPRQERDLAAGSEVDLVGQPAGGVAAVDAHRADRATRGRAADDSHRCFSGAEEVFLVTGRQPQLRGDHRALLQGRSEGVFASQDDIADAGGLHLLLDVDVRPYLVRIRGLDDAARNIEVPVLGAVVVAHELPQHIERRDRHRPPDVEPVGDAITSREDENAALDIESRMPLVAHARAVAQIGAELAVRGESDVHHVDALQRVELRELEAGAEVQDPLTIRRGPLHENRTEADGLEHPIASLRVGDVGEPGRRRSKRERGQCGAQTDGDPFP